MSPRPALQRIADRPRADQWTDEELVSLAEAAALFFPHGPFDADSLRLAIRRGELAATRACGRTYTTPGALRRFQQPVLSPIAGASTIPE